MAIKLKIRKPTGVVPWPLILLEGEEGAGKTYSAVSEQGSDPGETTGSLTAGASAVGSSVG
ncbi:hypothetical protein ACFUNF_20525 [Streptomyces sp. NPDC057291]|uniref:hypothetical protein n=1 Tax=Streptomyces sp. NPDC057291 TaxID=3346087 RepID=UPI003634683B